jgi:hypothetical protein
MFGLICTTLGDFARVIYGAKHWQVTSVRSVKSARKGDHPLEDFIH